MFARIIEWSINNKFLVLLSAVFLGAAGTYSLSPPYATTREYAANAEVKFAAPRASSASTKNDSASDAVNASWNGSISVRS